MPVQVAVLIGSLRRDSFNRRLAQAMQKLAPPTMSFKTVAIADLPPYNQDEEMNPHPAVARLKADVESSQGVVFVTPEYNRSIPGVLKNAIDHGSRPYGKSVWAGKPAGIVGASIGAVGTAVAQQHLRGILSYLDMPTLGQPEVFLQVGDGFFDDQGGIASADTRRFLQGWVDKYAAWVQRFAG